MGVGSLQIPVAILRELHDLWLERGRRDEYIGTLVNAWLARGGEALGIPAGESYVDVGTLHGYREAIHLLEERPAPSGLPTVAAFVSAVPASPPVAEVSL